MRMVAFAVLVALLLPINGFAQTGSTGAPVVQATDSGFRSGVIITTGVVGALVVADIVTRGALSGPLLDLFGLRAAPAVVAPAVAAPARVVAPVVAPVVTPVVAPVVAPAIPRPWWRFW